MGHAVRKSVQRERPSTRKKTDFRMLSEGLLEVRQEVRQAEEVTSGEEVLEGIRQEEIL